MKKFRSPSFPKMDPFLEILELAFSTLGISVEGFIITFYDSISPRLISEKIGNVLPEEEIAFMRHSCISVMDALFFRKNRSKNVTGGKPGAIVLYENSAGVMGANMDSDIAEAIDVLWLVAQHSVVRAKVVNPMEEEAFWLNFKQAVYLAQSRTAPDNNDISKIATEMWQLFKEKADQLKGAKESLSQVF